MRFYRFDRLQTIYSQDALLQAAHAKSVRLVKLFVEFGTRCDVTMGGERAKGFSPLFPMQESPWSLTNSSKLGGSNKAMRQR